MEECLTPPVKTKSMLLRGSRSQGLRVLDKMHARNRRGRSHWLLTGSLSGVDQLGSTPMS